MAPMWEAMSKPLLPILAQSFARKLKAEIEKDAAATSQGTPAPKSLLQIFEIDT
jgi:hypothetical protein